MLIFSHSLNIIGLHFLRLLASVLILIVPRFWGVPSQIEHKVETLTATSLDFPDFWRAALFHGEMKKSQV